MANVWLNNPFDNLVVEGARPQRYEMLASELASQGHRVVWWTAAFSHVHKAPRVSSGGARLPHEIRMPNGVGIHLLDVPPYARNVSLARLRSHHAFARMWRKLALAEVERGGLPRPDVIVCSLPPLDTLPVALELCRRWGSRFVIDVQDAWPDAFRGVLPLPRLLRGPAWRIAFSKSRRMARKALRRADAITGVGRRYLDFAFSYGAKAPMRCFPLGIPSVAAAAEPHPGDVMRVVYVGNMGASYDLRTLVEAVRRLSGAGRPVSLDIAGTGPAEASLRACAADCPAIRFHGFLAREPLDALLRAMDIGVIPMFDRSLVAVPNKVADYAAAGLAVVNSLTGETRELLEKYDAGAWYRAGNLPMLCAALDAFSRNRPALQEKRENALRLARERFLASSIYPGMARFLLG